MIKMDKNFIVTNDVAVREALVSMGFTEVPTSTGNFYFINDSKKMLTFTEKENFKGKYVFTNRLAI